MKKVELINVSDANNNKYYYMEEMGSEWKATWGRIGVTADTKMYSMEVWQSKYKEKIRKGYKDITALRLDKAATTSFKDMTDSQIKELLDTLQRYSKQHIAETYTVSAEQVTPLQVEEAQRIIDVLSLNICNMDASTINDNLLKLYTTIPRRMKKTQYHLVDVSEDIAEQRKVAKRIITQEQDNVDVMKQQVSMQQTDTTSSTTTIEDALGIKIGHITDEEKETIKKMMGSEVSKFRKAFKVTNHSTQRRLEERKTKSFKSWTKLLWHGSRNENWLNILKTGLLIRPSGAVFTGSMFGNGIYFANRATKSIGYTSINGSIWANGRDSKAYLAIYEVNTGMECKTKQRESWMCSCTAKVLKSRGEYDSLYCEGGIDLKNDELIVYETDQCSIKYLVEIVKD